MTAASTGTAVHRACRALADALIARAIADPASPLHGVAAGDVTIRDGALQAGNRRDELTAIVARSGQPEVVAQHHSAPTEVRERYSCHAFGAAFCEVHVDPELGEIRVARVVGAFAAGKILNPLTARSQLVGGIVMGIGMALEEHTVRDPRTGRVVTRDLVDYHVPVNADVPDIDVILVDEIDPYVNELGVKGVGELGITGTPAAIANAVYHATGRRVRDLPITLDRAVGLV
jgi:xanthine dehydrogenase YagR molybdenum-binding subunit